MNTNALKQFAMSVLIVASGFTVAAVLFSFPARSISQSGTPITGYAWSETIGWISLNGASYGLSVDSSGYVTGYAWSENIGWIKFGGLSSFPSGAGTSAQNAQFVGSSLRGWARACAGTSTGTCSTMTSRTDGWDGWIALSGTGYGVTLTNGVFDACAVGSPSCAWGDVSLGWIDFRNAATTYLACAATEGNFCEPSGVGGVSKHRDAMCTVTTNAPSPCQWQCDNATGLCIMPPAPAGALSITPLIVRSGSVAAISWDVENESTCRVTGTNGDSLSAPGNSSVLSEVTTFTLTCNDAIGTPYVLDSKSVSLAPDWKER